VVAAGLVRGRYAPEIVSAEMRIIARSVWKLFVFLLTSLVFILIGLQLSGILGRLTGYSAGDLMLYATLVSVVAIAVRFAWIYPATYLPRMVSARLRERDPAPTEQELFIMSWCGMRGIVSLAAALALPLALEGGAPFPGRDLIIFLTFVVIAVTLVVQGLTLGPLIRVLRVGTDWSEHEEEQHARFALGKAAIAAIDELAAKEGTAPELAERIRAEFAEKIRIAPPGGQILTGGADVAKRLRSAAIRAERQELIRIWRQNKISDDVLHHLEEYLDYEESRL
jgi:CPA1 family monovalent cation:H+ antiporter